MLRDMEKNKGSVTGKTGRKARPVLDPTPKLSDLGVTNGVVHGRSSFVVEGSSSETKLGSP